MLEEVIHVLERIKPGIDYRKEKDLIMAHVLDSLNILMLTVELEHEFLIVIPVPAVNADNFRNADAICRMVQALQYEE